MSATGGVLTDAFLAALDGAAVAQFDDRGALGAALSAHVASARQAWPGLTVDPAGFVAHLAARLGVEATPTQLAQVRAGDVYLALACASGDPAAIAIFETTYFGEIDRAAGRTGATPDMVAEVKARLRRVLFVSEAHRRAATGEYAGRGDLRGWVRVSALRELILLVGRARREVPLDDNQLLATLSPADDPELAYIRDLYRASFADAFRRAVAELDARGKSLLRYQLVEGLSIDDIGALHGVHRATAARWLVAAREAIAAGTRRHLGAQLGIAGDELESLIRLVQSRLDVSVERLLTDR